MYIPLPSSVFRITLPTKPSATTTSTWFSRMSLPSTLPTKRTGAACRSGAASSTCALPFVGSSPTEISPTRGSAMSSAARAYALPITPNCISHSGLQSTFAPASHSTTGPSRPGSTAPIAGRATPGIVRSRISAMARNAPLLPADTTAAARPSRTRSTASPSEVPCDLRTACEAAASIGTAPSEWTISTPGSPRNSGSRRLRSPTSTILPSPSRCARIAPATTAVGALSPPIASTAMTGGCFAETLALNRDPVLDRRLPAVVILDVHVGEPFADHGCVLLRVALFLRAAVVQRHEPAVGGAERLQRGHDHVVQRGCGQQPLSDRRRRRALAHRDAADARVLAGEEHRRAAHLGERAVHLAVGERLLGGAEPQQHRQARDRIGARDDDHALLRERADLARGERDVRVVRQQIHGLRERGVHADQ